MDFTLPIKQEEYNLIAGCINNERWAQKKLYEDNYPAMMTLWISFMRASLRFSKISINTRLAHRSMPGSEKLL